MNRRILAGSLCLWAVLIGTGLVSGQTQRAPEDGLPPYKAPVLKSSVVKVAPAYSPVLLSSSMTAPWGIGVTVSGDQVYVCSYTRILKWEAGSTSVVFDTNDWPCAGKWREDFGYYFGDTTGTVFHGIMDVPEIKSVGSTGLGSGDILGLDIDPSTGTIYFIDATNDVLYRLPNFDGHTAQPIASLPGSSWGLAVRGDYVYVSFYNSGTIMRIPKSGGAWKTFASGLGGPTGIDFDKKGNLYVVDWSNGRILRINSGTRTAQTIASGFDFPFYIAADGNNNVYFGEYYSGCLWKLTRKAGIKG